MKIKKEQPRPLLYPPFPPKSITPGLVLAYAVASIVSYFCLTAALAFENKATAMAFYGVYHREPLNQLIHFFGVPGILSTLLIMLAHLPVCSAIVVKLPGMPDHYLSFATVWFAFYTYFYVSIDVVGASLYFPFMYAAYMFAVRWTAQEPRQTKKNNSSFSLLQKATIVHIFSWYVQIHPGHKMIEGAQPALMQSLGGALTTAPLFAFYEGIWAAGFRQDFQQDVLRLVDEYTQDLCANGVAMKACEKIVTV